MPGLLNPKNQATDVSSVSAEEQQQYNRFVGNGMQMMFAEEGLSTVVESLKGDGNPVEGLANSVVAVVTRLEDSAKQAGEAVSGDVLYHGGVELLEQLADLAKVAGVHDFSEDEMESAMYLALDTYRITREQDGGLPQDRMKADMQELEQAERDGTLDQLLPGIQQFAQQRTTG